MRPQCTSERRGVEERKVRQVHTSRFEDLTAKHIDVFLASPDCSSYITGEILPMIGGYSGG